MGERAVNNPGSYEHASFYNFILNCFVEADEQCEGRITYDQFDKLLTRAAVVPRHFGLAPPESSTEARKKMFDQLELVRGDNKKSEIKIINVEYNMTCGPVLHIQLS